MSKLYGIQTKALLTGLLGNDAAERRHILCHLVGMAILFILLYLKCLWLPPAMYDGSVKISQMAGTAILAHAPYWYWLKPLLLLAECMPILFLVWNTVRTYQLKHYHEAWVMELMGGVPDDISAGVYYRGMFMAMLSSLLGIGVASVCVNALLGIPIVSIWLLCVLVSISGVIGWGVSALACHFPPDYEPLELTL